MQIFVSYMFVGVLATPLAIVEHKQSATGKIATCHSAIGQECKMKTLQGVQGQDEIPQYIKRVQHEKNATQKCASWKSDSMKKVQHEKKATGEKKLPQWNTEKMHKNSAL